MDINKPDIDMRNIGLSNSNLPDIDLADVSRRGVLGVLGAGVGGIGGVAVLMNRDDSSTDDSGPTVHDGPEPATIEVTDDHTFEPASLTIDAGTTVVWENVGTAGHSVTASEAALPDGAAYFASGGFDSEAGARNEYPSRGKIRNGETFEHTFATPGTYEYFCVPHEDAGLTGTVEVV